MGWPEDVVGPSGGENFTWDGIPSHSLDGGFFAPRELSGQDTQQLVQDWASAAIRAVKAGVDVLEIHAAHGVRLGIFVFSPRLPLQLILLNLAVPTPSVSQPYHQPTPG